MGAIRGIHHVSIKPVGVEAFDKTVKFYKEVLGLHALREWSTPQKKGAMLDTGAGLIELGSDGTEQLPMGAIQHVALLTDDVDTLLEKVREAGCKVTVEPREGVIPTEPPYCVRIAFFEGPAGELIELFCER